MGLCKHIRLIKEKDLPDFETVHTVEMGDESLLYTSNNYLEQPERFNFLLITLSSEVAPSLDLS